MPDVGGLVAPVAFLYGAALAGAGAAALVRSLASRGGGPLSLLTAGWCAFLPPLALLVAPLAVAADPHALPCLAAAHDAWHRLEAALHRSDAAHAALHGANWLLLIAAALLSGRAVFALSRMVGFESALRSQARWEAEGVYSLLSERPLGFTAGVRRPAAFLTTGLRAALTPEELRAVLAHEAAHVRRRDPLTAAALTLFYTLLPLPGSRRLLREWRLAVERACDRHAAAAVGSAPAVAAALLRVARLAARAPAALPGGACFAEWGEDVEGRVRALLAPAGEPRESGWRAGGLAALGLGPILAAALWLPHAVALFAHH